MRRSKMTTLIQEKKEVTTRTMTKMEPPQWLLAFWKEIDDKTFGEGFDCFTEDATCNLGVADWHGREENFFENFYFFLFYQYFFLLFCFFIYFYLLLCVFVEGGGGCFFCCFRCFGLEVRKKKKKTN